MSEECFLLSIHSRQRVHMNVGKFIHKSTASYPRRRCSLWQAMRCAYNVIFWWGRLAIVAHGDAKTLSFCVVDIYIFHCKQCNTYLKRCHGSTAIRSPYCCPKYRWQQYQTHLGLRVKWSIFFGPIVTKFEVSLQIFVEVTNIEFRENPSGARRVDTYENERGGKHTRRY